MAPILETASLPEVDMTVAMGIPSRMRLRQYRKKERLAPIVDLAWLLKASVLHAMVIPSRLH